MKTTQKPQPDRSDLSKLYPTPKSYDQKRNEELDREEQLGRRLTKYSRVGLAFFGSIVFATILFLLQNVEFLWAGGMGPVFFSFAGALALFYLAFGWVKYTNNIFYSFGKVVSSFWIAYSVFISILAVVWLSGWLGHSSDIVWVLVLTPVHFAFVFFGANLYLRR